MLLRSSYFSSNPKSIEKRWKDREGMVILSVKRRKVEEPLISIEVITELPKKMAKLWKIPYNKNYKPMIRTELTWDTAPITEHWKKYDELFEFRAKSYVGDPRHKEWEEFYADDSWMPLEPIEYEFYIISTKNVGGNVIPNEEIHVTDERTKKEMFIMGIGSGSVKNKAYSYKGKWFRTNRPILRWDYSEECHKNWANYIDKAKGHSASAATYLKTPPKTEISRFYIEFADEERWELKDPEKETLKKVYKSHDDDFDHSALTDFYEEDISFPAYSVAQRDCYHTYLGE